MRCVSFSLWGDLPLYCVGAIRNAELMPKIYPGWQMVLFRGPGVPEPVINQLKALNVDVRDGVFANGMFDRYMIYDDPTTECCLFRDTDSRINHRECGAVSEWLATNYYFHSLRDHPHHTNPFMGGMGGARKGGIKSLQKLCNSWRGSGIGGSREGIYGNDQEFLKRIVWPMVKYTTLSHDLCYADRFPNSLPFPAKFGDDAFVGEVVGPDEQPRIINRWQRIQWQSA
jgi:protein O-GlcNAc transferase